MQVSVNGKAVSGLSASDWRALRLGHAEPSVAGTVMTADAALHRYRRRDRIKFIFIGAVLVILAILVPPLIQLGGGIWILAVLAAIAVCVAFFFVHRSRVRAFAATMAKPGALPANPGTEIRAEDSGFKFGGQSWTWAQLRLDAVNLARHEISTNDNNTFDRDRHYYRVEQVTLAAAGQTLLLDVNTLNNGQRLVDNVYRRLNAASAPR